MIAQSPEPATGKPVEKDAAHFDEHFDPATGKPVGIADRSGPRGGNADLKTLGDAKNVTWLFLQNSETTDATVKDIARFTNLSHLFLSNTQVSGKGFKELANLQDLVSIDLSSDPVTDAGEGHRRDKKRPSD